MIRCKVSVQELNTESCLSVNIYIYIHVHAYINVYTLPVKSIWQPSKTFIPHPKSVIFNETS